MSWKNKKGQLHRTNGPAVEWETKTKQEKDIDETKL